MVLHKQSSKRLRHANTPVSGTACVSLQCRRDAKHLFANATAKSLIPGHGSEDVSYSLLLTFGSAVNVLHCFFFFLLLSAALLVRSGGDEWRLRVGNWSDSLKLPEGGNQWLMENTAWMHNHLNKIEFRRGGGGGGCPPVRSLVLLVVDRPELTTINLERCRGGGGGAKGRSPQDFSIIKSSLLLHVSEATSPSLLCKVLLGELYVSVQTVLMHRQRPH